jgi:probable HAF family extracellular repeat protein
MKPNFWSLCCLLTLGLLPSCVFATSYTFVAIDVPNALSTNPTGVNDQGQIVGTYTDASGTHGFLYANGSFQTLHDGSADVLPIAINDAGQYVARNSSGYLLYANGLFTSINSVADSTYPPIPFYSVAGINNNGQILANVAVNFGEILAVPFDVSSYSVLGGGAAHSFATGFNDQDAYVFFYGGPAGDNAYGPDGQIFTPAGYALSIIPTGLNDSNEVVGYYSTQFTSADVPNGFVYADGVSTTLDYPNAAVTELTGINNLGEIVGSYGIDPSSDNTNLGFAAIPVPSAVPEPGVGLLVFAGLGWFVSGRRSK